MKKTMQLLLYPLMAVLVIFFVREAVSQTVPTGNKPLVVVRFNQPNVYYEQSLYQAVSKAVGVKNAVMFDVLSVAPSTGNAKNDEAWQRVASRNTQAVVASLQNMGVPMSRMRIGGQREAGLNYDEVRIYAR